MNWFQFFAGVVTGILSSFGFVIWSFWPITYEKDIRRKQYMSKGKKRKWAYDPKEYRTVDGGHLCPYPDMTDADLKAYERTYHG